MATGFAKVIGVLLAAALSWSAQAQIIPDGTTATRIDGNILLPKVGGTLNGGTLYHNLEQFNVSPEGVVLGVWDSGVNGAAVNNIVIQVTGNAPSLIEGKIETIASFPNANLYLLNPNGILLAQQATINIGGSFHASTGTGLRFTGFEPTEIEFAIDRPAAIFQEGTLETLPGKHLSLSGGAVFTQGFLRAPNATIGIVAVSGGSLLEFRSPETVLGLNVVPGVLEPTVEPPLLELPQLARILRSNAPEEAKTVVINPNGTFDLKTEAPELQFQRLENGKIATTGVFTVLPGDISVKGIQAGNLQVSALSDLVLLEGQVGTLGNIALSAGNTTIIRDSLEFASTLRTNGNLVVRGDGLVDILALNFPESTIEVGGNLVFVSRNDILGDGNFNVAGRVAISLPPEEITVSEGASASLLLDFAPPRIPVLLQPSPRLGN